MGAMSMPDDNNETLADLDYKEVPYTGLQLMCARVQWEGFEWVVQDSEGYPVKTATLRRTIIIDPNRRHLDHFVTKRNVPIEEIEVVRLVQW